MTEYPNGAAKHTARLLTNYLQQKLRSLYSGMEILRNTQVETDTYKILDLYCRHWSLISILMARDKIITT